MDALAQDLRFGVRLLCRDRAFALTALLVLGVGIGVNNMLFTILNAHTIRGLPIDHVDRVVYVSTFDDRTPDRGLSYLDFEDTRNAARDVVNLAAFNGTPMVVSGDGQAPDRLDGAYVTENAFGVLGVQPMLGRGFSAEDGTIGAPAVVLLGGGTWASRYGSDPSIVGRSVLVNGSAATVIGVIPERSGFPSTAEIWLPLGQMPDLLAQSRDVRTLRVFGRARDGATVAEVRTRLETIANRLSRDYPDTNKNVRARVVAINERVLGRLTDPAWRAFAMVGVLVVLISCANVANLVLASSVRRTREIAIRSSLGASRRRVLRQLLIEGTLLAAVGGLVGCGLAMAGVRLFRSAIPENVLPYWLDYSFDLRVFLALVAVSAGTVFIFGLVPAFHASKTDVTRVLKDGGSAGSGSRGIQRWTTAFLAAEFGLAVVLLGPLTMSLRGKGPGVASDAAIDSKEVLTATVTLPPEPYRSAEQRTEFHDRLAERLRANPAIRVLSLASVLPLQGGQPEQIQIEGRSRGDGSSNPAVRTVVIGPRYFEAFGLRLVRGRGFSEHDGMPGTMSAIVNERMAETYLAGVDPLGQRVSLGNSTAPPMERSWMTIVGVAPDIRQRPGADPDAVVYVPYRASAPSSVTLLVRSSADTGALASTLRKEVQALDGNLPLYRIRTMAQVIRDARWNGRLSASLILVLTFIAIGLSAVGLYAVTAYGVSQRTQEIGLRVALGARPLQIAVIIGRRVLIQLCFGFIVGIIGTMLWDRTLLPTPGTLAADPVALLIVAAVLVVAAMLACFVPIRRATRLSPLAAMRD